MSSTYETGQFHENPVMVPEHRAEDAYARIETLDRQKFHRENPEPLERFEDTFADELTRPAFTYTEPVTGEEAEPQYAYNVYCFNRDNLDSESSESNVLVFTHALGSSPTTEQGKRILQPIVEGHPKTLVVAIGCEGTQDAAVDENWLQTADLETLAQIRMDCIEDVIETTKATHNLPEKATLSLAGQSYGGLMAYRIAQIAQERRGAGYVKNLALLAAPMERQGMARLLGGAIQEIAGNIKKRHFKELAEVALQATDIIPLNYRCLPVFHRITSLIADSDIDISSIHPDTNITLCTGKEDVLSRLDIQGCSLPNVRAVETTFGGRGDGHSSMLLDPKFCGDIIKIALQQDPKLPSVA